MKVYILLVYDDYYPSGDNIKAVYLRKEDIPDYNTIRDLWRGWNNMEIVEKEVV